jgi:hypothetical protein
VAPDFVLDLAIDHLANCWYDLLNDAGDLVAGDAGTFAFFIRGSCYDEGTANRLCPFPTDRARDAAQFNACKSDGHGFDDDARNHLVKKVTT